MFFPFICLATAVAGMLGFTWYEFLPPEEKRRVDHRASELAQTLFNCTLEGLSQSQLKIVYDQVKQQFGY